MDSGVLCAMMDQLTMMDLILMPQESYVDNWDFLQMVSYSCSHCIILILRRTSSGAITNISFGAASSSRPVHLDDVQCTGTEPNLLNCTHSATADNDCRSHQQDIGIICERSRGTV